MATRKLTATGAADLASEEIEVEVVPLELLPRAGLTATKQLELLSARREWFRERRITGGHRPRQWELLRAGFVAAGLEQRELEELEGELEMRVLWLRAAKEFEEEIRRSGY